MKVFASLAMALSMAAVVLAQSSAVDALLKKCNDQHDACDVAPNANHAFCASQFFSCIAPTNACDCQTKESSCLQNPPNGGSLFDCAQPLAECVVTCGSSSSTVATPTGTSTPPIGTGVLPPVISGKPAPSSNGTVVTPAAPSPTFETSSATKVGLSLVSIVAAGFALLM